MNKNFVSVWGYAFNARMGDECTAHRSKNISSLLSRPGRNWGIGCVLSGFIVLGPCLSVFAADLPTKGDIVLGDGRIGAPSGGQLTIDQYSEKLAIDWQQFHIGSGNKLTFRQPGSDSIALNRIIGAEGSRIMGQLEANGRVFLVNPNGVLFGADAQVNVGGLVASTLDISNQDFAAGNYQFKGDYSPAAITNFGSIHTQGGGAVALLGGRVSNQGVIQAELGSVALAAGNQVTLDFAGDGLLSVQVDAAVKNALVENRQLIQADGGKVLMTAKASEALLQTVVNNTGIIEARTLEHREGRIVLRGGFDGGTVQVAGRLDASAPNGGDGGFIDTSGAHVRVADDAHVTTLAADGETGIWLIDPTDFTIHSGTGLQTVSGIGADTLSSNLANSNVELQTVAAGTEAGDINVDADVSWNASTTLTLTAHNDININADITATGDGAGLALNYGGTGYYLNDGARVTLSGSGASFAVNGADYNVIQNIDALQAIDSDLSGLYVLGNDIDASMTAAWNGGAGFDPIGDTFSNFTGTFDGLGHVISDLTIDRPGTDRVGLFSTTFGSHIRNIGLQGGSITGGSNVGGLVGDNASGAIENAYASVSIEGASNVGGLVGNNSGTISHSYAIGDVIGGTTGLDYVGGLVGRNTGSISNVYASGSVTGGGYVGGLVGSNQGTISNAYASGRIDASGDRVGGLIGYNSGGAVDNAYATGLVNASGDLIGGLVGFSFNATTSDSYWNIETSGQIISAGGKGLTSKQMMDPASFTGWDIASAGGSSSIWRIYEDRTAPLLNAFLEPVTVTAASDSKTYDGNTYAGSNSYILSDPSADLLGGAIYGGSGRGAIDAGNYSLSVSGLYSGQNGYDISFVDGSLQITPRRITVTADDLSKIYGNTDPALSYAIGGLGLVKGDSLSGTLSREAGDDVGNYAIGQGTLTSGSNYMLSFVDGSLQITPRRLTVTADDLSKIYGNPDPALSYTVGGLGLVNGDDLSGTLSREAGEEVGDYAIGQGTLTAGSNYTLSFVDSNLQITPRRITVTADDLSKTYGNPDPMLSYTIGGLGLVGDDSLSGTLQRDPGEDIGVYRIRQGDLSIGDNYRLRFVDGQLTIDVARADVLLGDQASAYLSASPRTRSNERAAFYTNVRTVPSKASSAGIPYAIEDGGMRMPEGI